MLRARIDAWFRSKHPSVEPDEGREAYHSDIREVQPGAWASRSPRARGSDVERAMWLAGVSSRDFSDVIDIQLTPHLVTPVDDIVGLCRQRAQACERRADELRATLPPPNPYGRPPLPWHRRSVRHAEALYRASLAWNQLAQTLLSNRWDR